MARTALKSLLGASVLALACSGAFAEKVELYVPTGNIRLQGELLSTDNNVYKLKTSIGVFDLPFGDVKCRGDACPEIRLDLNMKVAVTDLISKQLVEVLATGLAGQNALEAMIPEEGAAGRDEIAFADLQGDDRGTMIITQLPAALAARALAKGEVDLVVSVSDLPRDLIEQVKQESGLDLNSPNNQRIVALEAAAPLVNRANRVRRLSLFDLDDIASGRITNWADLGGRDAPIRFILPDEGTAEYGYIRDALLIPYRIRLSPNTQRVLTFDDAVKAVEEDENAITFGSTSRGSALRSVGLQRPCGLLADPTEFEVKAEEYAFSRRIRMYTGNASSNLGVLALKDFANSSDPESDLRYAGFFSQTVSLENMSSQGGRLIGALNSSSNLTDFRELQGFVDQVASASRISTAFRFVSGSSQLDAKAVQDVALIAEFLANDVKGVREVMVIGFTDDVGDKDTNVGLALTRAERVRQELLKYSRGALDPNVMKAYSFGPLAPVDCNDTLDGRARNRRVEIWIR